MTSLAEAEVSERASAESASAVCSQTLLEFPLSPITVVSRPHESAVSLTICVPLSRVETTVPEGRFINSYIIYIIVSR